MSETRYGRFLKNYFPWVVLILTYIVVVAVFARFGKHYLNADVSSEMVLAKLVKDEGGLFGLSHSWLYSTELRVLYVTAIYRIFMMLFPENWYLVQLCTVCVCELMLIASSLYLFRPLRNEYKWDVYITAVLLLPFSIQYTLLMTYGNFYIVYTAITFLQYGIILRIDKNKGRFLRLLCLLAMGFFSGLSGVRMLMFCAAPILMTGCIALFLRAYRTSSFSDFFRWREWRLLWTSILNSAVITLGYLVNVLVLSKQYTFKNYGIAFIRKFDLGYVLSHFSLIPEFMGYTEKSPLFSLGGIDSVLALGLFLIALFSFVRIVRLKSRELPETDFSHSVYYLLLLTALIGGVVFDVMLDDGLFMGFHVSYFMPGFLLFLSGIFYSLSQYPARMRAVSGICMFAVFLVFAVHSYLFVRSNMRGSETNYEEAAQWLEERGYVEGFASFWQSNVLTQASNGHIEMWTLYQDERDTPEQTTLYAWLQKKSHLKKLPEGKCFFYVTSLEYWNKGEEYNRLFPKAEVVSLPLSDDKVYLLESSEELLEAFPRIREMIRPGEV